MEDPGLFSFPDRRQGPFLNHGLRNAGNGFREEPGGERRLLFTAGRLMIIMYYDGSERGSVMKKNVRPGVFLFVLIALSALGQEIREPVWAGKFYSDDPQALADRIREFLRQAPEKPGLDGVIRALVIPHASYDYSGRTAAVAYKLIQGRPYDTVVILGPSHRYGFRGVSIYLRGGFKTPLGVASVDEDLAAEIAKKSGARFVAEAFQEEHSIEVQIPFLQMTLPGVKIVPVVMGYPDIGTAENLAEALAESGTGKKILVIASTDMSHFLGKTEANAKDAATLKLIKELQADKILKMTEERENILCGGAPVATAILYARKLGSVRADILDYSDSAASGGDVSRVVGYGAVALSAGQEGGKPPDPTLTETEKKILLDLARSAVRSFVEGESRSDEAGRPGLTPLLETKRGAFVTLKIRGRLRGCIGFIEPIMPLHQAVTQAAVYAASQDPRFAPVSREELGSLEYEISVLSPLREIEDISGIKVGRHGLFLVKEGRSGLLLPQVPVENGWDRKTFLQQLCFKAGLPANGWKKGAKIYTFEAVVFR